VSDGFQPHDTTSPAGFEIGKERSRTACTALAITVVAPMASASVATVAAV
jgi:hypothetical protein